MAISLNEIFMYTRIRILSLVVLFFITVQAGAQSTPRENVIISSQVHGFYEHLPADYNTSPTKRYPLIVEWHGVGEVGNGSMPALDMVTIHGLGRVAKWGILPDVTFNGQSYSFIVLNPQFINSIAVSILDIDAFLEYAFAHYRVDRNRVYMTGFSLGAMLTYQYTGASNAFAQKLTAIIPLSPCSDGDFGTARTIAVNNVAVYGFHSNIDTDCPTQFTVDWNTLINTANNGVPPIPSAVFSLVTPPPGAIPHDIFWNTYEPSFTAPPVNKNIYNWMIQYSRNIALPVTLKKFSAEFQNDRTFIEWTTSNENNAKEFVVERAGKNLQFGAIAKLAASATSTIDKNYNFVDDQPLDGLNYYRLKLVNLDNSSQFFEVRKVLAAHEGKLVMLSSNPLRNDLRFAIQLSRREQLNIIVTDLNGSAVLKSSSTYSQGMQEITLSTSTLASGTYLLQVRGESFVETKKIVRQ